MPGVDRAEVRAAAAGGPAGRRPAGSVTVGSSAALRRWVAVLGPATAPHHEEPTAVKTRRRVVVGVTSVVGAVLLGLTLQTDVGSPAFYPLAVALAITWALGALLSGPLHLGRLDGRRHVLVPAAVGAVAFGGFAAAAVVVRRVPTLDHLVSAVISRADAGNVTVVLAVALLNGLAEELFFRGALYSACAQHRPVLWSTLAYVAVTAAAGNLMLVLAAAVMGTVFALERRSTRGVLAPTTTHLVWSTLMIFCLPR